MRSKSNGSLGVFPGFALITLSELVMSVIMLGGKIFGKVAGYIRILGNALLFTYTILVTFVPGVESKAVLFAMPGGLLTMAWIIIFTYSLFRLGNERLSAESACNQASGQPGR